MPWQGILVGVIVIGAALFVGRNMKRQIHGAAGAGADFTESEGCDKCPAAKGGPARRG